MLTWDVLVTTLTLEANRASIHDRQRYHTAMGEGANSTEIPMTYVSGDNILIDIIII